MLYVIVRSLFWCVTLYMLLHAHWCGFVRCSDQSSRLKVSGSQLLAPDGTEIRLRGFNLLWWGPPTEQDVTDIKALGANSVRYMFGYEPRGKFDPAQLAFLDEQIRLFTSQKLWVIITIHKFDRKDGEKIKGPYTDAALQKEFLDLWNYVIARFKNEPYIAAWEPLNEPHNVAEDVLRSWYRDVIKHIRTLDSQTPIVVEGANYSHPQNLGEYIKFDDPQLIYSFHMYQPLEYTHQEKAKPVAYPSDSLSRQTLAERMEPAFRFSRKYQVPVYCGEFGVLTRSAGYEQWLQDTAALLEEHGMHWTHWAWMVKSDNPVDDSFDCNTLKTGIYETLKAIFYRSLKAPQRQP